MSKIEEAISKIKDANQISLASHVNPDGDNIGSLMALYLALKKLDKEVYIIKTDETPSDYMFLPAIDKIRDQNLLETDLLIVLDCGDVERLGKTKYIIEKAKTIINVDHHISNTEFGDYNIIDPKATATGEIVYELITKMGISIDKDIATCLYTAISTDTGSFMYDSVTEKTHEIIANLIRTGINVGDINIRLYQSRSIEKTNLFISSLATLKTYYDKKIATVKVTQEMIFDTNSTLEDSEGIIDFVREIDSVEVACLLKETEKNKIKISLRSKAYVDVAKISTVFNGGGHIRAAGCTIASDIVEAEKLIVDQIIKMW